MVDDVATLRRTPSGCRVRQTAIVSTDGLLDERNDGITHVE